MSEEWGMGIEDSRQDDRGAVVVLYCTGCSHQWLADGLEFCPDCDAFRESGTGVQARLLYLATW